MPNSGGNLTGVRSPAADPVPVHSGKPGPLRRALFGSVLPSDAGIQHTDCQYNGAIMSGDLTVAIIESAAAYRHGLEIALDRAGIKADSTSSPQQWAVEEPGRAVVVTMRNADACQLIEDIAGSGGVAVALLPDPDRDAYWHAFRHGAAAAADWSAEPELIISTILEAARGLTLIPRSVIASLPASNGSPHGPILEPEEVEWLGALAHGATVVSLADEIGYSERAMFRKLHDLYVRLGVTSRAEALVEAERLGLLPD